MESRKVLWEKTRQGIIHCYHNALEKYDYFMKADDDTFVVVENLRYILADKDPNVPFIMGRRFKVFIPYFCYCTVFTIERFIAFIVYSFI